MGKKTQTRRAIRIHPLDEMHSRLEAIQPFLSFSKAKGTYVTKEMASLACMEEGLKVIEKEMAEHIQQ